jgi:hypothetical protein
MSRFSAADGATWNFASVWKGNPISAKGLSFLTFAVVIYLGFLNCLF